MGKPASGQASCRPGRRLDGIMPVRAHLMGRGRLHGCCGEDEDAAARPPTPGALAARFRRRKTRCPRPCSRPTLHEQHRPGPATIAVTERAVEIRDFDSGGRRHSEYLGNIPTWKEYCTKGPERIEFLTCCQLSCIHILCAHRFIPKPVTSGQT
jgi:hypothetical protein